MVTADTVPGSHVSSAPTRRLDDPPGGTLLWIVVAAELLTFSLIFALVALLRLDDPVSFRAGQSGLDARMGLALTVALITSGWLVAEGVHAFRSGRLAAARRFHAAGVAAGAVFVVLKLLDYAAKHAAGHWLGASDFWDAHVLATGFHFVHVMVGLFLLAVVGRRMGRVPFEDAETAVAGTALFWHMCDVAWFFLFPLFFAAA